MQPIVRVVDIWKQYGDEGQNGIALRGTNLEIKPGEVVALFGKSGSGKTTLLNLIAGLDRPTKGRIEVEGRDLESIGESGRTDLRRRRLGFIFQFFNLLPTLTAYENVYLSLELLGRRDQKSAKDALAAVGLEGKGARYPHELSGGEQQRVAIARAIVKEPTLILDDEPTGNLDTTTGSQILELLQHRCQKHKMSLLMVSHTPLTWKFADRILHMVDGVITEPASCTEITR